MGCLSIFDTPQQHHEKKHLLQPDSQLAILGLSSGLDSASHSRALGWPGVLSLGGWSEVSG